MACIRDSGGSKRGAGLNGRVRSRACTTRRIRVSAETHGEPGSASAPERTEPPKRTSSLDRCEAPESAAARQVATARSAAAAEPSEQESKTTMSSQLPVVRFSNAPMLRSVMATWLWIDTCGENTYSL